MANEEDFDSFCIDEEVQKDYCQGYVEREGEEYIPWSLRKFTKTIWLDYVASSDNIEPPMPEVDKGPSEKVSEINSLSGVKSKPVHISSNEVKLCDDEDDSISESEWSRTEPTENEAKTESMRGECLSIINNKKIDLY
jgi:hypothetical protein